MMRYLFCYDICDSRRLRHVSAKLGEFGFRMQKSFFCCELTDEELREVKARVVPLLDVQIDKLAIYVLCDKCMKAMLQIGQRFEWQIPQFYIL